MSEPSAKLWLIQVDSDLVAAQRVWDQTDHRTYCQAIAKFQQAVEKSVKAVVAAMKEVDVSLPAIGYQHHLAKHLEALAKLPKIHQGLQSQVDGLLTYYHRGEIDAISSLAPRQPDAAKGEIHRLNTEYPYETSPGICASPAQPESFSESQVMRFRILSDYLFTGACKIASALSH